LTPAAQRSSPRADAVANIAKPATDGPGYPGPFYVLANARPLAGRLDSPPQVRCGPKGIGALASPLEDSAAQLSGPPLEFLEQPTSALTLCTRVPMQPRGFPMTPSRCPPHSLFHKSPLLQLAFATRADVPRWRAPGQGMQGRREGVIAALFGRLRTPQRAVRPAPPVGRGGEGSGRQKARSTCATSQLPSCPRARPSN
jgi:hypothetical protein